MRRKFKKHGMSYTREYRIFQKIDQRCNKESCDTYKHYGARGITLDFDTFEDFYAEIGPAPTIKHTVDRIDTGGGYTKGNLRWATRKEQAENRRAVKNKTGCTGVKTKGKKFHARIQLGKKSVMVGSYFTGLEASQAYLNKYIDHHGKLPSQFYINHKLFRTF